MTKFHRNFIDFSSDHEKRVSDRQTGCSGCARSKATPGAAGIHAQNFAANTFFFLG